MNIEINKTEGGVPLSQLSGGEYFRVLGSVARKDDVYQVVDTSVFRDKLSTNGYLRGRVYFINIENGKLDSVCGEYWDVQRITDVTFIGSVAS